MGWEDVAVRGVVADLEKCSYRCRCWGFVGFRRLRDWVGNKCRMIVYENDDLQDIMIGTIRVMA